MNSIVNETISTLFSQLALQVFELWRQGFSRFFVQNYTEYSNVSDVIIGEVAIMCSAPTYTEMERLLRGPCIDLVQDGFRRCDYVVPDAVTCNRISEDLQTMLDSLQNALENIHHNLTHEIDMIKHRHSRSNLIADLFHVAQRDIIGGAFEIQHKPNWSRQTNGQSGPWRDFLQFQEKYATEKLVLDTLDSLIDFNQNQLEIQRIGDRRAQQHLGYNVPSPIQNKLRCKFHLNDQVRVETITEWVIHLLKIYDEVAEKYSFLMPNGRPDTKNFIRYIREKKERNEQSHFEEEFKKFMDRTPRPQSFSHFLNKYESGRLRKVFPEHTELQSLFNTIFDDCCQNLKLEHRNR